MLDPMILHKLTHTAPPAEVLRQLAALNPELAFPAALPLLAARLLGASGVDDDADDENLPHLVRT